MSIARHEAAHAVVGLLLGEDLVEVTIVPEGDMLGRALFANLPDEYEPEFESRLRASAIASLAGPCLDIGATIEDRRAPKPSRSSSRERPFGADLAHSLLRDSEDRGGRSFADQIVRHVRTSRWNHLSAPETEVASAATRFMNRHQRMVHGRLRGQPALSRRDLRPCATHSSKPT